MSIAKFTHVSEKQYAEAMGERRDYLPLSEIPLPKRATRGSAGYDFTATADTVIPAGGSALIPTGIRCEMENGWVLMLFPRSSLGFKYGIRLSNPSGQEIAIAKGDRFCQGVLLPFGTAEEEDSFSERTGGFGSTGER